MKTMQAASRRPGGHVVIAVALLAWLLALPAAFGQVTITTIGGGPKLLPPSISNAAGSADGLTFNTAQFNNPFGLALDTLGNLFIADGTNSALRKVANLGLTNSFTSTIVAGLNQPVAVAVDTNNFIYVLTHGDGAIRKYDNAGVLQATVTTALTLPTAFTFENLTNLVVVELGGAVKRVTQAGVITVLAAAGSFSAPRGVAVLDTNSYAIAESGLHDIKNFNPGNGMTNLIAGGTTSGAVDGLAADARFNNPHQIVRAPDGSLIVADRGNHRVRVVSPEGIVSTLYGVATNQWVDLPNNTQPLLAGWVDGTTNAAAREPVGVTVTPAGTTVFVTEVGYHLLRRVTGVNFVPRTSGGSSGGGGTVNNNTNLVANLLTLGFQSGEGSSAFIGASGQRFFAPVTLTLLPGENIYSMGFALAVTNVATNGSPAVTNGNFGFRSMLKKADPNFPGFFLTIPPQFVFVRVTNIFFSNGQFVTNIVPVFTNAVFSNSVQNILNVNWLETRGQTNLYDTTSQDLISISQAHINQFNKAGGSVIVGAYYFQIPTNAAVSNTYRIQVFNGTAATNVSGGISLFAPTNGSLTTGPINSIKEVTVGIRQYLVGDVSNFRWLNAGDFGDNTLSLDDASQTFQSAIYLLNIPPVGSDFFDAMDSSNGATNALLNASSGNIDAVMFGDGQINVDDVFVTLRRAGDPFRTWYARYWSNGVLNAVVVSNSLPKPTFGMDFPAQGLTPATPVSPSASPPLVTFSAGEATGRGSSLFVPIYANVQGNVPVRVMMLRLAVKPLDGSPALTYPVQFQFLQAGLIGNPFSSFYPNAHTYAGVWLNDLATGLPAGPNLIGNLVITLPANAPANAAYAVTFEHASASPNGISLFPTRLRDGLVTATDRSASSLADGISDAWRLKYFGTLYNILSAANGDAVGDGVSNYHKFRTGADPNDPTTTLRLLTAAVPDAQGRLNAVRLRFPTRPAKTYVMEYAPSLFSTNWTAITTNITGNGSDLEFTNMNATVGLQFYRVRLVE